MSYKFTAPLTIVVDDEKVRHHHYAGGAVPDFVKGDQLKRLIDRGFVEKVDAPPAEEPSKPATVKKS